MTRGRKNVLQLWAAITAGACSVLAGSRIVSTYLEYYGDGAPYYGRTTNMDKWQSPAADLTISSGFMFLSLVGLFCMVARWRRTEPAATRRSEQS